MVSLIRQNLVGLICVPLAFALIGLYLALSQTPIFRATAWLQLDPKPVNTVSEINEVYDPGYGSYQYYVTQSLILKSRKLAIRLIDRLELENVEEFSERGPNLAYTLKTWLGMLPFMPPPPPLDAETSDAIRERVLARVQEAISVELATSSTLFQVHFDSRDPKLAADAANALADLYIEELLEARLEIYRKATTWLTEKLGTISGSLRDAEGQLQSFRDSADIVNVGGSRGLLEEELRDLSERLREAQRETTSLESTFREIRNAGDDPDALTRISALLLDPVVNDVTERFLTEQNRLQTLEKRYGARHPSMAEARASLETARQSYLAQLQIKARSIESQYNIARRNQQQLANQVASVRQRLKELDRKQFEIGQLQREVTSNQQLYDLFLSRFKEVQNNSSSAEVNARIADPAYPPTKKHKPETAKIALIAGGFGLIFTVLAVLLKELLNTRIETVEDLEAFGHHPVVGVVPAIQPAKKLDKAAHYFAADAKTPFAESVRSLKTAVALGGFGGKLQCIVVTSTEPGEGKTTLSSALAAAFATNDRTLIIDTDMRRSRISEQFGHKRNRDRQGLTHVLNQMCSFEDAVVHDEVSGVDILPAGAVPANPAMLLDSDGFVQLLDKARAEYRYVVIDTPPLGASSDVLHLSSHADAFLLVARSHRTHKSALQSALRQLNVVKAPVLGFVLNSISLKRGGSYYGYYGYRY